MKLIHSVAIKTSQIRAKRTYTNVVAYDILAQKRS